MNNILENFFLTLANGGASIDFLYAFLSLYVSSIVLILLVDPILE